MVNPGGVDDYVKGVAVALLTDQVDEKTGYVAKFGGIVFAVCVLVVILADGWWQCPAGFVAVLSLMFLAFVWVTKRGA